MSPFGDRRFVTAEDTAPRQAGRAPGLSLSTGCSEWLPSLVHGVPGAFTLVTKIGSDALSQEPTAASLQEPGYPGYLAEATEGGP